MPRLQGQPRDSYMEGGGGGRSFGGGGGGYTDRRAGGRKSYGGRGKFFNATKILFMSAPAQTMLTFVCV